jgi:coenzyme F420-reducing hydrogenase delta subunit
LKIYLFYCANSVDIEALRQCCSRWGNDMLKTVSLPCSGRLEPIYLLKTFETGADGAVLITCRKGECRRLEGNLRAHKRAEAVRSLLEETGLGTERLLITNMDKEGGAEKLAGEIENLCTRISSMVN